MPSSAGTPIASPKAVHAGGSSGLITYSILSGNEKGTFSIQPSTGKRQEQRAVRGQAPGGAILWAQGGSALGGAALKKEASEKETPWQERGCQ